MKYLTTFLIIATLFFSCNEEIKQDNIGQQTSDTTNVESDSLVNRYTVKTKDSIEGIVIIDNLTHQELKWNNIPDFCFNRSPLPEFHKPNLYLTRNFNIRKQDEWKEELWVYNKDKGKLLVSKRGLNFSVNNKQNLLAYTYQSKGTNISDTLIIMNLSNNETSTIKLTNDTDKINECWVQSLKWSANNETVFGLLTWCSASNYFFFSYNYTTNTLKRYAVPEGCYFDFDLNPNTGQIIYCDYPPIYGAGDDQDIIINKKEIHLYKVDFATQKRTLIKKSIAEKLGGRWVTNHSVEITDTLNNRETFTLKE